MIWYWSFGGRTAADDGWAVTATMTAATSSAAASESRSTGHHRSDYLLSRRKPAKRPSLGQSVEGSASMTSFVAGEQLHRATRPFSRMPASTRPPACVPRPAIVLVDARTAARARARTCRAWASNGWRTATSTLADPGVVDVRTLRPPCRPSIAHVERRRAASSTRCSTRAPSRFQATAKRFGRSLRCRET